MNQATEKPAAPQVVARRAALANAGADSTPWDSELCVLRGENRVELRRRLALLRAYLAEHPETPLAELASSLNAKLEQGGLRLGVVASTTDDLAKKLARAAEKLADLTCHQIRDVGGVYFSDAPLYPHGRIAFLFPGEGAQYLNMLGDLGDHFAEVCSFVNSCDALEGDLATGSHAVGPQGRFLFFPEDAPAEERQQTETELRILGNSIFSVLVADGALYNLLDMLGLKPDAIAGHSAGELGALWAAGCLSQDGFVFQQVGETMFGMEQADDDAQRGVLLAVGASREAMEQLVAETFGAERDRAEVYVAMDNCPHQAVLVGRQPHMERIEAALKSQGRMYERLPIPRPYHTRLFQSYMGPINDMFAGVSFHRPRTTIYSATTGEPFPDDPAEIRRLTLSHWAAPVEFTKLIRTMHDDGVRLFVEVGPRGNLTAFVEDILRGRQFLAVPANVARRSGTTQIHHMAAQLSAHGVSLNLAHLYARRNLRQIDPFVGVAAPSQPIESPPASGYAIGLAPAPLHQQPASSSSVQTPAVRNAAAPMSGEVARGESGARVSSNRGRAAVVGEHWSVMGQFLDTQRSVMQQYLEGRGQRRAARSAASGGVATRRGRTIDVPPRDSAPLPTMPPTQSLSDSTARDNARSWPPREADLPMLGEIVRHEAGRELVMRRRLDLNEDLYAGEHTVGGRTISHVDAAHFGLPIGPMTFTLELMAESASVLFPGLVVTAIKGVRLQRWLAFETEDPSTIECTARLLPPEKTKPEPGVVTQVQVEVKDLGNSLTGDQKWTAATGVVLLAERYPEPPLAGDAPLSHEYPTVVSIDEMYNDLFHGDVFRGVTALDRSGDEGIEARVEVLPRKGLFRSNDDPQFLTDPVLLDVIMHPLGAWHLEQTDRAGRVLLPFELTRIDFYGPRPEAGTQFRSRGRIQAQSSRHFVHGVEAIDANGRLWCRLDGAKYWRFYLPFGDVNFHGRKDEYFISKSWPDALRRLEAPNDERGATAYCVKLEVPADLQNPAMLQVSAQVSLTREELKQFRGLRTSDKQKSDWVFGRMAAKDAARQLWFARHGRRLFPADIQITHDEHGKPSAHYVGQGCETGFPHVSISHCNGLLAGLASVRPYVGVDVEKIEPREASFEAVAFSEHERGLLAQFAERSEGVTRLWCAKEAVAKAVGRGLSQGTHSVLVREIDPNNGDALVELSGVLAAEFPALAGIRLKVATLRENNYIVAVTLCERSPK
jgi:malonyl CoA-acyl carrier protein transacylase/phosphopantetheinyl transferase